MLPKDAQERKSVPIYSGFIAYFPDAMAAVAELSRIGNDQHNPGQPLHWAKEKSGDELDALTRHLAECGTRDSDGVLHDVKVAWRAFANLQRLSDSGVDIMAKPLDDRKAAGGVCRWEYCHKGEVWHTACGDSCSGDRIEDLDFEYCPFCGAKASLDTMRSAARAM